MRPYQFINGPWENSELPTIVKDDPAGGDPHILAVLKRIHNPEELYDLCRLANDSVEIAHETGLTPRQLAEQRADLLAALKHIRGQAKRNAPNPDEIYFVADQAISKATDRDAV